LFIGQRIGVSVKVCPVINPLPVQFAARDWQRPQQAFGHAKVTGGGGRWQQARGEVERSHVATSDCSERSAASVSGSAINIGKVIAGPSKKTPAKAQCAGSSATRNSLL
jgi:hypothetical protein